LKYKSPLPKNLFIKISLLLTFVLISIVVVSFSYFSYNLKEYLISNSKFKVDNRIDASLLKIERDGLKDFCDYIDLDSEYNYKLTDEASTTICQSQNYKPSKSSIIATKNFYLNSKPMNLNVSLPIISVDSVLEGLIEKVSFKALPLMIFLFLLSYLFIFYYSRSVSKIFIKTLQIGRKLKFKDYNDKGESISSVLDKIDLSLESNLDDLKLEIKKNSILLQSISDGILALNTENEILFQNIRFNRLFSYYKFSSSNINSFIGENISKLFENCLETGEDQVIYNYNLNDRIIDIRVSAILSNENKVEGAIGVFRDITKVQKTRKLKAEFITNISHELKTPLTSIKGYSQMLIENSQTLNEIDLKYVNKILNNSNKLIDIYDNLLTLSSIEASKNFNIDEFEFEKYLCEIFENLKLTYDNSSAQLKINLDLKILKVNEKLFKQVFYNLMENSFKYSKENLVISVDLSLDDYNIILKFSDNGIGIPADKLSRIFERFYRTDESRSSEVAGSGIGLSIVKHIVEKHGGKIYVSSDSSGSSFKLILPQN